MSVNRGFGTEKPERCIGRRFAGAHAVGRLGVLRNSALLCAPCIGAIVDCGVSAQLAGTGFATVSFLLTALLRCRPHQANTK